MSSMTDEHMILTIEKMQAELRSAMKDICSLKTELQARNQVSPVVPKKSKKVKFEGQKPAPTGIVTWNAYRQFVRDEMEAAAPGSKISNEAVMEQARQNKQKYPEGYAMFCMAWLEENQ